jgi:putative ABC transport system permease protein
VSSIVVKVDSIENIESVKAAITNTLGKDKVEVSSSAQSTDDAISSLESIQKISIKMLDLQNF